MVATYELVHCRAVPKTFQLRTFMTIMIMNKQVNICFERCLSYASFKLIEFLVPYLSRNLIYKQLWRTWLSPPLNWQVAATSTIIFSFYYLLLTTCA